jgi:hypothetical protein
MGKALLALVLGVQAMSPVLKFDSGRAWEHLRQLVAIGPRRPLPRDRTKPQASRISSPRWASR